MAKIKKMENIIKVPSVTCWQVCGVNRLSNPAGGSADCKFPLWKTV